MAAAAPVVGPTELDELQGLGVRCVETAAVERLVVQRCGVADELARHREELRLARREVLRLQGVSAAALRTASRPAPRAAQGAAASEARGAQEALRGAQARALQLEASVRGLEALLAQEAALPLDAAGQPAADAEGAALAPPHSGAAGCGS
ncbi:unnamed protein product [Prorocentrum cordatum]|uniref:Uncharacterized protein n=1 Tax=Prorocentrum cordatum TaxID=2364126 RepID=A0ABN9X7T2_9DINO|nr:unnamed protein product [Polarella glacialis]